MKNNYLYQGDYSELDDDIGWYDFALRSYDAQLGRFWQSDPYDQFPSPYTGMGNDPVNMTDPSGGWASTGLFEGLSNVAKIGVTTFTGAFVGLAVDLISGGDGSNGLIWGAGIGLSSNLLGNPKLLQAGLNVSIYTELIVNEFTTKINVSQIEQNVRTLIEQNDFIGATRLIINSYPSINEGLKEGTDFILASELLDMPENLGDGAFKTINDPWPISRIYPKKHTFMKYYNGGQSYGLLVRQIYHETVHVRLRRGKYKLLPGMKIGTHTKDVINVHEVVAIYEQITNKSLPVMTKAEICFYAGLGYENHFRDIPTDTDAGKYWRNLIKSFANGLNKIYNGY